MTAREAILVFVRAPVAGQVKTRLAAEIGADAALRIYRRLAEHAVQQARAVGPAVSVRIHHTPGDAGAATRHWLGTGATYLPQADGDLGARMEDAFRRAFAAGFERVAIVGSDLPDLAASDLRRALDLLSGEDAVLGPARDGGYWLLGLRRPLPALFSDVPWSTDRVLAVTVDRLRAAAIEPALLDERTDVDKVEDLPPGWREWAM